MVYKYFSIFSQISSSADNANAAAQASATDNAPHNTASSGTGQNKNNNASSTSASENNSKINPSNHVGGTDRPSSATADRSQNGEIDYRKVLFFKNIFLEAIH